MVMAAVIAGIAVTVRKKSATPTVQPQQAEQWQLLGQPTEPEILRSISVPAPTSTGSSGAIPKKVPESVTRSITAPATVGGSTAAPIVDQAVLDLLSAPAKK